MVTLYCIPVLHTLTLIQLSPPLSYIVDNLSVVQVALRVTASPLRAGREVGTHVALHGLSAGGGGDSPRARKGRRDLAGHAINACSAVPVDQP